MHAVNWVDVILIVIIGLGALGGTRRGFLRGSIDIITILVSLVTAAFGYHRVADFIVSRFHASNVAASVIGFAFIAITVQLAISFLVLTPLSPVIGSARTLPVSRQLDTVLGLIPGAIKGLVAAMAVVMILVLLPFGNGLDPSLSRSALAQRLLSGANQVAADAEGRAGVDLSDFMIVTEPVSDQGMRLPFTVASGLHESSSDEAQMLEMLNASRSEHGLSPLIADPRLQRVAVAHSQQMLNLGYFAHTSPLSGSPTDRFDAAGISYSSAGENIAYAPTVDVAERGLMRSPGHRANILSDQFTRVGIGIVVTPFGTRMFTQEFAGP